MMPEWKMDEDLAHFTNGDEIVWEKVEDERRNAFRSTNEKYPFVIEMRRQGAVILVVAGRHESLLSRGPVYPKLWAAVRKQEERSSLDAELSELIKSYK